MCCCDIGGKNYGECGQGDPKNGCDFYGSTLRYTVSTTPTCNTDNPINPDLAV